MNNCVDNARETKKGITMYTRVARLLDWTKEETSYEINITRASRPNIIEFHIIRQSN